MLSFLMNPIGESNPPPSNLPPAIASVMSSPASILAPTPVYAPTQALAPSLAPSLAPVPAPVPAPTYAPTTYASSFSDSEFDWKMAFIGLLGTLLLLSILGLNISEFVKNTWGYFVEVASGIITAVMRLFGYTAGTVIEIAGKGVEVAGKGVGIAGQGVEFVGQELGDVGEAVVEVATPDTEPQNREKEAERERDITYPESMRKSDPSRQQLPQPEQQTSWKGASENPLASPAYQGDRKGQQWCFAGTFQGKRGCAAVDAPSQCMSGQLFPSQHACLAPE
jgi:hypothetical protein